MQEQKPDSPAVIRAKASRDERVAQALRENLKRRKKQQQARASKPAKDKES